MHVYVGMYVYVDVCRGWQVLFEVVLRYGSVRGVMQLDAACTCSGHSTCRTVFPFSFLQLDGKKPQDQPLPSWNVSERSCNDTCV